MTILYDFLKKLAILFVVDANVIWAKFLRKSTVYTIDLPGVNGTFTKLSIKYSAVHHANQYFN